MAYRVSLSAPAESDAYAAFDYIRNVAPTHVEKRLVRLFQEILTLEEMPDRCAFIPEAKELCFTARHLISGRGRGTYRIIFHVHEDQQHVRILRIWHASRDAITATYVVE